MVEKDDGASSLELYVGLQVACMLGKQRRGWGRRVMDKSQVLFVLMPCGWDGEFALEEMTTKERHRPTSLLTFFPFSLTCNSPACTRILAPQVCG
jgi:hypothetical protein